VVNKDGTGSGTVTSDPSGISCGSTCSTDFSYGTSVTLSASAASGSVFAGWSGACSGTGTCTVSMTANRSVTASFTITTYTLAGTISGSGTVNVNPPNTNYTSNFSLTYNYGTSVTLSATAGTGYTFAGWSGDCSGTGTCTVGMTANRSVTASFVITRHNLVGTISGSGTVNANPPNTNYSSNFAISYIAGTSVTLSATPLDGYTFTGWSGDCSGTGTCTVSMTANRSVTASFAITTYTLSGTIYGLGHVILNPPPNTTYSSNFQRLYDYGTSVTLSATPQSGYVFAGWSSGPCSGDGDCTVSMTDNRSVTAWFYEEQECYSDNDCPDCTESGWCPDGSACTATFYGVCTDGECTCGLMYTYNCPPYCVLP